MKKNYLLFVVLFLITHSFLYSQTLWQDDFETYDLGDFLGENGWIRDGGQDEWVQIVNIDSENGKSIQLNTPIENDSGIFVTHYNDWTSRDEDNDVLEIDFDFYTGQQISEGLGMIVIATDNFDEVLSITMASEDNAISIYAENLDEVLVQNPSPNSWYHLTITYNSINGEIRAQVNEDSIIVGFGTAGLAPNVFDLTSIIESNIGIDNVTVAATNESVLSTMNFTQTPATTKVFPNPAITEINLQSNKQISKSIIYDITGRKIKEYANLNQLDLSDLRSGNYLLQLFFTEGFTETHKIIKQ